MWPMGNAAVNVTVIVIAHRNRWNYWMTNCICWCPFGQHCYIYYISAMRSTLKFLWHHTAAHCLFFHFMVCANREYHSIHTNKLLVHAEKSTMLNENIRNEQTKWTKCNNIKYKHQQTAVICDGKGIRKVYVLFYIRLLIIRDQWLHFVYSKWFSVRKAAFSTSIYFNWIWFWIAKLLFFLVMCRNQLLYFRNLAIVRWKRYYRYSKVTQK